MAAVQITCPHCCSTLSFGQAVEAGAVLPCLICNRTFTVRPAAAAGSAPHVQVAPAKAPSRRAGTSVPQAQLAPPRTTAATPSASGQGPRSKAPPAAAAPASSGTAKRAIGGLALVALALLMLGGVAYLIWTNVLAERLARGEKDGAAPLLAVAKDDKAKDKGNVIPPVIDTKDPLKAPTGDSGLPVKKDGKPPADSGDDDVGNLKKPEKQDKTPPLTEVKIKPPDDTKKKPDKETIVQVPVAAPPIAPGVDAERIDAAIAGGVKYLKDRQLADGSWQGAPGHANGLAALGGLALLECKVPADDPAVQKVAERIRANAPGLRETYDGSLAILFLDRLGDPKDRELIQTLALRLIAGQTESWTATMSIGGGWDYHFPLLSAQDAQQYNTFLKSHWPWSQSRPRPAGFSGKVASPENPAKDGKKGAAKDAGPAVNLRQMPLDQLFWNKGQTKGVLGAPGDNSNTQFAMLGLWTARRYDVAAECPLLYSYYRFQRSQGGDGGWGYDGLGIGSSNTMTCAGLLGIAVGTGALPSATKTKDPAIEKGLNALAQYIAHPSKDADARPPMQSMYFLWSVERVGVLYDLKTIGGKDWYAWGAQILLANQHGDGHWFGAQYLGQAESIDTCFALLFLKRANLTSDLTESLRLNMVIRDPGTK